MLIGMFGLPFTMLLVPACTEFTELLLNLMLMGWCMGCIDCVANLRMILRFGTNVSPFLQVFLFSIYLNYQATVIHCDHRQVFILSLIVSDEKRSFSAILCVLIPFLKNVSLTSILLQAMHFCYGLGAFISPMIAAPFTLDVECSQPVNGKVTLDTFEPTTNSSGAQVPTQVTVSMAQHLSHSESAFFILASIQVS